MKVSYEHGGGNVLKVYASLWWWRLGTALRLQPHFRCFFVFFLLGKKKNQLINEFNFILKTF